MRRTSLYLLITLFWMIALRAMLVAQGVPQAEHTQSTHQYILGEAYKLLKSEEPGLAMKLRDHIGVAESGDGPWQRNTIMVGVYREDCEDIVYGYGGADRSLWPAIDINTPGNCIDAVYKEFRATMLGEPSLAEGFTTLTHFWDPNAEDNYIGKDGIVVQGTGLLTCLSTPNQTVTLRVQHNAWDKMQKLARPNGVAIRDYWWKEQDRMYDAQQSLVCVLPEKTDAKQCMLLSYNTLAELFNKGTCEIMLPGEHFWRHVQLTDMQRKQYVWEIFGRMCHLLADMSVPAHVHKDMHMGNMNITRDVKQLGIKIGEVTLIVEDEDSYETWVGSPVKRWWTAEMINDGLIDISNAQDPLYHLMSGMRNLTASFSSDDFNGSGPSLGIPRNTSDIPDRHNITQGQPNINKHAVMCSVRDHTLPHAIRATATLLAWFAEQLQMDEYYEVRNVGAPGFDDFFAREHFEDPFPSTGTVSGTMFAKSAGDDLSLRSHTEMHPVTNAKFRFWSDDVHGISTMHQFDEYVGENQDRVIAEYRQAFASSTPALNARDQFGSGLHNIFPSFLDPWSVYYPDSDDRMLWQPAQFSDYHPVPGQDYNGGIHINCYDTQKPERGYYSIRASKQLDRNSHAHASDEFEVGDYAFVGWDVSNADMYVDPRNKQNPPHPAYPNPEQYDTKIVDFLQPGAVVNAMYKAHRCAVHAVPTTRSNSQRKVALDAANTYHAVYESNDAVWYVRSTDGGMTWSGERRVSEAGEQASRPSVAAAGNDAWITYVAGGEVVLRVTAGDGWHELFRAPVGMVAECTPAVAVLGEYEGCKATGPVVCATWEDQDVLKFSVFQRGSAIVTDQVLVRGKQQTNSVDQPRYPSIAASTMAPRKPGFDHGFHIAWIENGSIYYCRLGIDRKATAAAIVGWSAGGTAYRETVHARTGSVGAMYPARHAPSIAVTELGTVHVGFDVVNSWSTWPGMGTKPGGLPAAFVLRERINPTSMFPTWNTGTSVVSTGGSSAQLCSPTLGAQPSSDINGKPIRSLRVAFNDRPGLLNVLRLGTAVNILAHEDGMDPSMTVWGNSDGSLLDMYSVDGQQPYDWNVLASKNNLAKSQALQLSWQKQLLAKRDADIAALGISDLRLADNTGDEQPLSWEAPCNAAGDVSSASFIPSEGTHLLMTLERFAHLSEQANAEVLVSVADARTDEILRADSFPLCTFAEAAGVATHSMDLTAFDGVELRVRANVHTHGENWEIAAVDRYAGTEEAADDNVAKNMPRALAGVPSLAPNHPNPFNPTTGITFSLPRAADVRLNVYNLLGEFVTSLAEGHHAAGTHSVRFNGSGLPSGVYVYRLESAGHVLTRTMHLVK
ncbi:T9SS type A sorting domain-containing protein [bacterium]|nr:T9SS type A sorting domain-containing protein [bacterium]